MPILMSDLRQILKTVLDEHFPDEPATAEAIADILDKCQDNFNIHDDETEDETEETE